MKILSFLTNQKPLKPAPPERMRFRGKFRSSGEPVSIYALNASAHFYLWGLAVSRAGLPGLYTISNARYSQGMISVK